MKTKNHLLAKERKKQITFQKPKKLSDDKTLERMRKQISLEDMDQAIMESLHMYDQEIALASNLKLLVKVEKDEKEKMSKQFEIQTYEQITPNWNASSIKCTIMNAL